MTELLSKLKRMRDDGIQSHRQMITLSKLKKLRNDSTQSCRQFMKDKLRLKKLVGAKNLKIIIDNRCETKKQLLSDFKNRSVSCKKITQKLFMSVAENYYKMYDDNYKIKCAYLSVKPKKEYIKLNHFQTISTRLQLFKESKLNSLKTGIIEHAEIYVNCDSFLDISFTNKKSELNFDVEKSQGDYSHKKGQWHVWNTRLDIKATFFRDYYEKLIKKDLLIVGGLITLYAEKINIDNKDIEVYEAICYKKSRSNYTKLECYIARCKTTGANYHGKTLKSAISNLEKKLAKNNYILDSVKISNDSVLLNKAKKYKDIPVFLADSDNVGNCTDGTQNFCNKYNINYDSDFPISLAKLAEIAEKEKQNKELRAVILWKLRGLK